MNRDSGAWFFGWFVTRKGSTTSGNYGHKGRKGLRGGSMPGGGHAAIGIPSGLPPGGAKYQIDIYRKKRTKKPKPKTGKVTLPTGTAPEYRSGIGDMDALADNRLAGKPTPIGAREEIAIKAGLGLGNREPVDQIIRKWASTSNDTSLQAISFQEAIAEEFGVPLSSWQKSQLEVSKKPDKEGLTAAQRGNAPIGDRAMERRIAKAMYDRTQRDLADLGYKPGDTIKVFRGVASQEGKAGDQVDLSQNTVSSWSLSSNIADGFAKNNRPGITIAMEVPVSSIFSTFRTGLGTAYEKELVIFGVPGNQATVVSRYVWTHS